MKYIAILGHGVVGGGCARMLTENTDRVRERVGEDVFVRYILDVRDLPDSPFADRIVHDFDVILNDPEVSLVAEAIGGSHPAFEYAKAALEAGKHVVTSNKECVSRFGVILTDAAEKHGVTYRFEASCGGGIPLIGPLLSDLAPNRIDSIDGILNGTTNYILTRMHRDGCSFEDALAEAQQKGYAERDPSADVDGYDARRKINILCGCATGMLHHDDEIHTEGIRAVRTCDVRAAAASGYAVKLLGRMTGGFLLVAPHLVSFDCPLSHTDGVFNAALVHGNYVGDVLLCGRGAGAEATASAMVGDIAKALCGDGGTVTFTEGGPLPDFADFTCPRYLSVGGEEADARRALVPDARPVVSPEGEFACITKPLSERDFASLAAKLSLCASLRVRE